MAHFPQSWAASPHPHALRAYFIPSSALQQPELRFQVPEIERIPSEIERRPSLPRPRGALDPRPTAS
eukprot:scaffold29592_cov64-Phaeocystis_antarctica.AAC.1